MEDIKIYNTRDLVLKVNRNFDPEKLKIDDWSGFIDLITQTRSYQKEAIVNALLFLASGRYDSINDLVKENFSNSIELKKKYSTLDDYFKDLQIPNKLNATIDLATGTGKSYCIYAIARIMLGLGVVSKVLVLCPSLTIEDGLKQKFSELSADILLNSVVPEDAVIKNPRIIDGNSTVMEGDICVENIHAIYENTGSSIINSIGNDGSKWLILNDEAHHIYNINSSLETPVKKWKEFLLKVDYNFKYILGFTGTAYVGNEYFNDVIYRYSLRNAIIEKNVKNIEYIQNDDSVSIEDKLQKIYQNHLINKKKYPLVKPLTILITKDIKKAKSLTNDLIDFLMEQENISLEECESKVLIVTSAKEHAKNVFNLKFVDEKTSTYEWIISVSMLTEGWDVKNVFQIVPWEDKAFNSKLLIAQVLGRGLRIPKEYAIIQPIVIVFNHDSWSRNIKTLVDEILEIETKITCKPIIDGERSKYNFQLYNLNYNKTEVVIEHKRDREVYDFSRIKQHGIKLSTQIESKDKISVYQSVLNNNIVSREYAIKEKLYTVDEVVEKIYNEFSIRDWEGRILKLDDNEYTKNNLPPFEEIKGIVLKSMEEAYIEGEILVEKNRLKILQAYGTLLRKKGKTISTKKIVEDEIVLDTRNISKSTTSLATIRIGSDSKLFYSSDYEDELSEKQCTLIDEMRTANEDISPMYNITETNIYQLKTPMELVVVNGSPEYKFVNQLIKNYKYMDAWIKSRDIGFYSIEYGWKKGEHYIQSSFNPDFFIKVNHENEDIILVIEIKDDNDVTDENRAKYKAAIEHFSLLNEKMKEKEIKQKYIFNFLSPSDYSEFFTYLQNKKIFQGEFRSELDVMLIDIN